MKLPLRYITSRSRHPSGVQIVDSDNRVIATACSEKSAEELVLAVNAHMMSWRERLIGPPLDEKQAAYNAWANAR